MAKLKVYGRVRNRIVLGIANAYLTTHPNATLDELSEAFPNELNSNLSGRGIFSNAAETNGMVSNGTEEPGLGILTLANGERIEMVVQWTDEDYAKLDAWAKRYAIEVVEPQKDMEIPKEGFLIVQEETNPVETRRETRRGERELTSNQKHLTSLLLTLMLLFTILLFSRGNTRTNDEEEIIQYRNLHKIEGQAVDLHKLATEQRRKEKENYDLYQDEEIKLAEELAKNTKEAFNSLLKQ
ncbi:MAG: hypothetical protein IKN77_09235 [Paludibacteraceae bacterium]|nr:hypothetical protein [Paludibacteraceae bacterium]